jgi:hypothetical protein
LSDGWYPPWDRYFVEDPDPADFPVRQGDLMWPPDETPPGSRKPWVACVVIHPSCELGAKTEPPDPLVVQVFRLGSAPDRAQEAIVLGMTPDADGLMVAWAHTFFLPPVGEYSEPMFADFRKVARVPREQLTVERRVGALTHDARVYFIRRKLYWEQRWFFELDDVYGFERTRISGDSAFAGPRPPWAIVDAG